MSFHRSKTIFIYTKRSKIQFLRNWRINNFLTTKSTGHAPMCHHSCGDAASTSHHHHAWRHVARAWARLSVTRLHPSCLFDVIFLLFLFVNTKLQWRQHTTRWPHHRSIVGSGQNPNRVGLTRFELAYSGSIVSPNKSRSSDISVPVLTNLVVPIRSNLQASLDSSHYPDHDIFNFNG